MRWGIHTILNLAVCCPTSIRSSATIQHFSDAVVKAIQMEQYGKTQIQHFGLDDKLGYSFQTHLTTSHLCGHFAEESNSAYLDCFSCKDYDPAVVEEVARHYFKPAGLERVVIHRGTSFFASTKCPTPVSALR
jgi:S-adenosylmethionine/arginine decarboxylase-like enzyme